MTLAPATTDPDLSTTLPEKFPVACACKAGEVITTRTKANTISAILWNFASAGPSADLGQLVRTIVRFIVRPLSTTRLRWLLQRLCCTGLLDCKNWPLESQHKLWPTRAGRGILKSFRHGELTESARWAETLDQLNSERTISRQKPFRQAGRVARVLHSKCEFSRRVSRL